MRFEIRNRLYFEYDNVVRHSQNELRACPTTDDHQTLLSYRVSSSPPARFHSYTDYWGTRVDTYGIREPHVTIEVMAEAAVETRARPLVVASPNVALLRDPGFVDPLVEYLEQTRHTTAGPGIARCASEIRSTGDLDVVSLVLEIHRFVHRSLTYQSGVTDIGITADEVLTGGAGVCQDFAHLAVALCRHLGIPARYVSGYFFTANDASGADVAGDMANVQTHAWFEAAIPGGGWLALDPTNALQVGERHVAIGRGRDYDDVKPISGVYRGASDASLVSGVEIRRLPQSVVHQHQHPYQGAHLHQQQQAQQ